MKSINGRGPASKIFLKKNSGIIAGVIAILISVILRYNPMLTETIYGRGLYPFIRSILDFILRAFPFSLMVLFYAIVLYLVFKKGRKTTIRRIFNGIGWLIFAFYFLWGYNYFRIPLTQKWNLSVHTIDEKTREQLIQATLDNAKVLRIVMNTKNNKDTDALTNEISQDCLGLTQKTKGLFSCKSKPVGMFPKSLFFRVGIAGMYFPYTGQATYEPYLEQIGLPFTIAHEWFHSAGVAPESEANFLAYLVCNSSENVAIKYSAQMNLLIELLIYYNYFDKDKFQFYRAQFSPEMESDLKTRNELHQKYSNPLSRRSDLIIDQYLQLQNQNGISDYHQLAEWVVAWQDKPMRKIQ